MIVPLSLNVFVDVMNAMFVYVCEFFGEIRHTIAENERVPAYHTLKIPLTS